MGANFCGNFMGPPHLILHMSLQNEFDEERFREALRTAARAERSGEEWNNSGPNKNTHFEQCIGDPEICIYVERYDGPAESLEVMFWVDFDWFEGEYGGVVWDDAPDELHNLIDDVINPIARSEIDGSPGPGQFMQVAQPSLVFTMEIAL